MGENVKYSHQIKHVQQDTQWTILTFQSARGKSGVSELILSSSHWDKLGRPVSGDHIEFNISVKEFSI